MITSQQVQQTTKSNAIATQAFVAAEHLHSGKPAAFLMFVLGVGTVVGSSLLELPLARFLLTVSVGVSFASLVLVVKWFRRFGGYELADDDFLAARRKLKSMLWLWLAVLISQLIGLVALVW